MLTVLTESGSRYAVRKSLHGPNKDIPCLIVTRIGVDGRVYSDVKCVAVYPDRVEPFMDSKTFESVDGKLVGKNKYGNITCQFVADQVRPGMNLVNTKGFKSTRVTKFI